MTAPILARSALVLSTTPPVPREYGNRNRVFQTIEFLRESGFGISFLLYALDEEWEKSIPPYFRELADQFDYFAVIPNSKRLHQRAAGFHHTIDEWWDDAIGQHLTWLFQRKSFDILFVNYTFLSKAFTYAPRGTLRILDTHDIFTDRRESFERHGVEPEFFYTNQAEERIAFDRADAIIAIKASEAKFISSTTSKHVITIPYWDGKLIQSPEPWHVTPAVFSHESPLRLGFIGAHNSVNVVNMQRFLRRFSRYVQLYNLPVEILIAGNVCRQLSEDYPFVRKLGRVASIAEFYRNVDVIICPLEFSTGIKIKVGEALAWQVPVLATHNAFDGFRAFHHSQTEETVASLCRSIAALAYNELSFGEIVKAGRRAAQAALKAQDRGFTELRAWIRSHMRRILFITDRPFWCRATFVDEMISQAIEYVSHIGPVIVAVLGCKGIQPTNVFADVKYVEIDDEHSLSALFSRLQAYCEICAAVLFMSGPSALNTQAIVSSFGIGFWRCGITHKPGGEQLQFQFSASDSMPVLAAPLRYAPISSERRLSKELVAIFRPEEICEWDQFLLDFLAETCAARGLESVLIPVPASAEFDPAFLRRSMSSPASRVVVLAADSISRLFVLQAAHYRDIGCLVIGEGYVFPQAVGSDGETPSVEQSIDLFLRGAHPGKVASNCNVGWANVWASLEVRLAS
jgi:hypothetical protein